MARIRWTEEALEWLKEIRSYIAQDKPAAAHRVARGIYDKIQMLKDFPELGYHYQHRSGQDIRRHAIHGFCPSHRFSGLPLPPPAATPCKSDRTTKAFPHAVSETKPPARFHLTHGEKIADSGPAAGFR